MRALNWLKKLRRDERGNVLLVGAASLPLILGAAGLAVDTLQIAVQKREMQRAADSAALAGAYAVAQGESADTAVHNDLDENSFPILTSPEQITIGARLGFPRTVRVQLTAAHKLPFISLFTNAPTTVTSDATAAVISNGNFCMLSLYTGTDPGIDVNGNANVNLSCGMAANSRGTQGVTAGGSSSITASPIMAVGGLNGQSNNFVAPTTLQPYSLPQKDPFADVPDPPQPNPCLPGGALTDNTVIPSNNSNPCYTSMSIGPQGTVNLPSNTPVTIYGGDIDIKGRINGTGSTIVMTGPGGAAGNLTSNSQAVINMTAPTSGTYESLLFYRDRRAAKTLVKINGGAGGTLTGGFYFPTSDIEFTGNSGMNVNCLMMVGQKLIFRGTADLVNSCTANGHTSGFQLTYVRLVN